MKQFILYSWIWYVQHTGLFCCANVKSVLLFCSKISQISFQPTSMSHYPNGIAFVCCWKLWCTNKMNIFWDDTNVCANESIVLANFTWFQFHRYHHGRHRCTGTGRRNEPYASSIGGRARTEVDAWFQRTHPQLLHWETSRTNHIRIHGSENYFISR